MIILGITGTLGAGKGTIVDYLVAEKGFSHYSVRAWLLQKVRAAGLPENRDSLFNVANELRAQYGPSYVTDQLYEIAVASGKDCVIESIRTPGEIDSLRKKGNFYLLAIDADPKIRFERIVLRQSETDKISYQTFIENEAREMTTTDPAKQNLRRCIEMTDFTIRNDGTRRELTDQLEKILPLIQKKDRSV